MPPVLEPGQTTNLSAPATDPDGDTITYTWSAPAGTFSSQNGMNTIWTAPNAPGNYPLTVTAQDGRGGTATSTITIPVTRREALVFEDVHFDFDMSSLKPEAIRILDDAVSKLQANPGLTVTIEGHTDSVGTAEYNLSLGERRANAVRDYLLNRGIAAARMRTVSYGEERPKADNNTAEGRATNRRAQFVTMTIQ
jgi:peptidoglycan-associated lipoprotein